MDLEQVIVTDMNLAIFQQTLRLLNDAVEVFALLDIIHVEAISTHILNKVLRAVSVIPDL